MNPEIRDQWASALESGEYIQGCDMLTTVIDEGSQVHCCLGVLCQLAVKAGVIPEPEEDADSDGTRYLKYGAEGDSGYLPREVTVWAAIDTTSVPLERDGDTRSADFWNDARGLGFKDLASMIRTQL